MENEIVHEIHKELKQKVYCNYLLSIKKWYNQFIVWIKWKLLTLNYKEDVFLE